MRIILTGSPGALYRPTAADIPADKDLTNSFLRWLDLRNMDFSAYDLTDVDILDSDCRNVILPAKIDHLLSRRTDWTGATIPIGIGSATTHDLIREVIRQKLVTATGNARTAALAVRDYIALHGYKASWHDAFRALINATGWTSAQARTRIASIFAAYPKLAKRLATVVAKPQQTVWPSWVEVQAGGEVYDLSPDIVTQDRWLLARGLEWRLFEFTGRLFDVHVTQIEPWPFVEVVERGSWTGDGNWWRGLSYLDA